MLAVNTANVRQANRHAAAALRVTAGAFRHMLDSRERILLERGRLLSADFAFKQAAATGEHGTLLSTLENHRARVGADVMMLLDLEGDVLADTLHPSAQGRPSELRGLLGPAQEQEGWELSTITFVEGTPYQIVLVPLLTPDPSAWVAIGFELRDAIAADLQKQTGTHVSLLAEGTAGWTAFCSTLAPVARTALERGAAARLEGSTGPATVDLAGDAYLSWVEAVGDGRQGGVHVIAVLQRSLDEALAPFLRLRIVLLVVFGVGVTVSVVGGVLIASRVTRPVADLARAARRVARGRYDEPVRVPQRDELGLLADSFNEMMTGISERDRIRDLLGRVVSPEIAEELLSKRIELGGEQREVSVLFADIRDFTTISETEPPQRIISLLNTFLTRASEIVEAHGGVVADYIGDSMMALFGAPTRHDDDATRSVRTALDLWVALPEINRRIVALGCAPLSVGVGIHTSVVVAGSMGSESRLKYSVIGDGVNLASRLEGLTRRYGVGVIASAATREACRGIVFRELDRVRVKGRRAPVGIHQPLGPEGEIDGAALDTLALHGRALDRFRARDWEGAAELFGEVGRRWPGDPPSALYAERIARLRVELPGSDWDGTATWREK